jgi:hypothetical protein
LKSAESVDAIDDLLALEENEIDGHNTGISMVETHVSGQRKSVVSDGVLLSSINQTLRLMEVPDNVSEKESPRTPIGQS